LDPVLTVAANASGGVTGKMISPQSIAIGAAAVDLVGKESDLFRFTVKHSFLMLFIICLITVIQAYVTPEVIPVYEKTALTAAPPLNRISEGFTYLQYLLGLVILVAASVLWLNRKVVVKNG
jgi:lactate permease